MMMVLIQLNVASKHASRRSSSGGKSSTTSSARIKAETDRAVPLARVAALKEKRALEVQEQKLKRRREQLELEAKLAASTAKLAVFQASDIQKRKQLQNRLNPMAKEYKPVNQSKPQQGKDW